MPKISAQEYKTKIEPVWCPGCGDFGVLQAICNALSAKDVDPKNLVFASGIGCSGRLPPYVKSYGFHTVHGRVLPIATGIKIGNPNLTVIAVGGDGDAYAIGGGHIPHTARRNPDIKYIVMDNGTYGLTKGQSSPTSPAGMKTHASPYGTTEIPLTPIAMAIAYDVSFVARAYSGKAKELAEIITKAMDHRGFALINVISPCITFYNTYKELPPQLAAIPEDHDRTNRAKAFELALDSSKIHLGIFYQHERPTYESRLHGLTDKAGESGGIPRLDEILLEFT
ncbi:MAG: 2-oxoacid:ferredoxin oxidoreductase subunit beta [Candidatus Omnitrophica bacterium]|nr:2-oxoacid:ferredoxin oxidoreductase subunit beta [Candidatus Omnitrophota bacterium]